MRQYNILLILILPLISYCQKCTPYDGWIDSQEQIDYFNLVYPNCSEIEGSLVITGDVSNLDSLYKLRHINGSLSISDSKIVQLHGLNNLDSITYGLSITSNANLQSISGFKALKKVINLNVYDNSSLETIQSFDSILSIKQDVLITRNSKLKKLTGLNNLLTARKIDISHHDSLTTLNSLNNLITANGDLIINKNKLVKSWKICKKLETVLGVIELRESPLDTLEGFENLKYCKKISVADLAIKHLNNFNSLEKTEVVSISDRKGLITFRGFNSLKFAKVIDLYRCDSLLLLDAFNNLDSIEQILKIGRYYYKPIIIRGFNNLIKVNEFSFEGINRLVEVSAFSKLEYVNFLQISGLYGESKNLDYLSSLKIVSDRLTILRCKSLTNITGLKNLDYTKLKTLVIGENDNLSVCNTYPICKYIEEKIGTYDISKNKSGCNSAEEILEACKTVSTQNEFTTPMLYFPNPTSGFININSDLNNSIEIRIFNTMGEEIRFNRFENILDISMNGNGIYYIQTKINNFMQCQKIILLK